MFRRRQQGKPTSTVYKAASVLARDEKRRNRRVLVGVISSLVLVVAGLITWRVVEAHKPPPMAVPSGVNASGLVVAGAGPVRVDVYLDFLCPGCKQLNQAATPTLNRLVADQKITVVWHPLATMDNRSSPPGYSTRAAAAAGCASDAGKLEQYGEVLFANQPPEGGPGLSDDQLIDLGGPVGLNAPSFAQCVRDVKYRDFVGSTNNEAAERGITATPTVLVQGNPVPASTVDQVVAAINAAG